MKFISLFAGIGGIDLGLERAGMACVAQVEIDPFCRKVLEKHWPCVPKFDDIRSFRKGCINEEVDLVAGGFPCQDISYTGVGAGIKGARSGLWSEMFRILCEFRPSFVVVENVAALLGRGMGAVLADLASIGFDAEWRVFSGYEFGAADERERVFIIAYPDKEYGQTRMGIKSIRATKIFRENPTERLEIWLQAPPECDRVDHGLPKGSYENRVGALGNAVKPQIAEYIGRRIIEVHSRAISTYSHPAVGDVAGAGTH